MSGKCGTRSRAAATVRIGRWGITIVIAAAASVASAQMSVPPAEYRPVIAHKAEAASGLRLPQGGHVRRIALPLPAAAESVAPKATAKASATSPLLRNKGHRLALGFARAVPPADRSLALADLPWQATASGTRAAQIVLTSPGAAAVRLGLALKDAPPGLAVRFQGSVSGAPAFGPFTGGAIAAEAVYWSPALEGDTGTIEFELPAGAAPGGARLELPMISHLSATGRSLRAFGDNIGFAEPCEVDIACLSPTLQQELASATNAVARMMVTIQGTTYLCSGTVLNDSLNSFTPYFLTANHCLDDIDDPAAAPGTAAASAGSINTYWFYQAATCGSLATPNYVLLVGGARLLARSVDYDWALVQLNAPPPSGATFAAWSAEGPLNVGIPADAIHHPGGDLKKFSQGNVRGYRTFSDGSSFVEMRWTSGATENGSSGSGLFTQNPAASYFEVRGTLSGGESACTNQQGTDYYTRLDVAYPLLAQYLVPGAANPSRTTVAVEYYNATQDSYFVTVDVQEIAGRDNGSPAGWVRTGYRFLAYTDPAVAPTGAQPVCRLYSPPDTRFYSASPQECASMLSQPGQHFVSESAAAFYIQIPDAAGTCPANTRAVFRFVSNSLPSRWRYTAEVDLRDSIVSDGGWTQEGTGSGSNRAVMCTPLTGAAVPAPVMANYQGLWWNASEPGWGINFAHQGETIFATWFTYDVDGSPLWMVASAVKGAGGVYSGTLYRGTGPAFNAVPFDPAQVTGTPVGTIALAFADNDNATFAYTVNGVPQSKVITRQVFSSPLPTCAWGGHTDAALATNYQDLWWNAPSGSESGWGINFTHQGNTIFATWFTYGADGGPLWFAVSALLAGSKVYTGNLYIGTGPAYNAAKFDPAKVIGTPVGTATLAFADGNHATFTYAVNGITQTKTLTREIFVPPGTVCQ